MTNSEARPSRRAYILELQRLSTPTVYSGSEQIARLDAGKEGFNIECRTDFMPEAGPMAGYAVTVVIEPGNTAHVRDNPSAWSGYRCCVPAVR